MGSHINRIMTRRNQVASIGPLNGLRSYSHAQNNKTGVIQPRGRLFSEHHFEKALIRTVRRVSGWFGGGRWAVRWEEGPIFVKSSERRRWRKLTACLMAWHVYNK